MGIHDMGWKERDIFGKIRFMNYAGCKKKFKVANFVARYPEAASNATNAIVKSGVVPSTYSNKRTSKNSGVGKKKSKLS